MNADRIYSNFPDFGVEEKKIRMTNSQTPGSNALPVVAYVYAKIHKEMSLQHMNDDKHSNGTALHQSFQTRRLGLPI